MYFWTNTPNQVAFITLCGEVNRLNAYINDPNVSEEQAQIYQVEFIAAKAKMALQFLIVNSDWEEWLFENELETPVMSKNGSISAVAFATETPAISMDVFGSSNDYNGQVYYWNDFYRMLALRAFLLRSAPGAESASYHPETFFHE